MNNGKSRLIEAARRVREQIYSVVKSELLDESRTYKDIAIANGISVATVQKIAANLQISRQVGPRPGRASLEPEANDGNK